MLPPLATVEILLEFLIQEVSRFETRTAELTISVDGSGTGETWPIFGRLLFRPDPARPPAP